MLRCMSVIMAACSLAFSGCGTFSDRMCGPINDQVYYRGVGMDLMAVHEAGGLSLLALDIPFSAVADTLSVPFLAYDELTAPSHRKPQSAREEQKVAGQSKADPGSQEGTNGSTNLK